MFIAGEGRGRVGERTALQPYDDVTGDKHIGGVAAGQIQ